MEAQYKLSENVKVLKVNTRYNVYITKDRVYFIPIDRVTPEIRKLKHKYNMINGIGMRFGILGALVIGIPVDLLLSPKINREREMILNRLRVIDGRVLHELEGYSCARHEITFEERKKDRFRVHFGNDWLLLDGGNARALQLAVL